ncbi:DUF4226 domain-containing protein [Nocardia anaemiae]|uniref:DUF4226 domain-containing protein n=1 Tax=Nocardia anaemiae TaxID=263910 RepID=UPI0007A3B9B4|nr:DUF4226 domain-containing protein [Nocardia anaemiae]
MVEAILPTLASALAALAGPKTAAAPTTPAGSAPTTAPNTQQTPQTLRQLAAMYGPGDDGAPHNQLAADPSGHAGAGETAKAYRLRQLYHRHLAQAFNTIDNELAACIRQLAGANNVDRKTLLRILREVDVGLAELGPAAFTRDGYHRVEKILDTALRHSRAIVHASGAHSTATAQTIHQLANQYLSTLAGMPTRQSGTRGRSSSIDNVLNLAQQELGLGVHETNGNNHVNRPYNIDGPWCAAFATWVWQQAGIHVNWSGKNYVPTVWSDAQRMGLAGNASTARPGDLIVFPGQKHIGLVVARNGNTITTIEGNSGDAVRQHTYSSPAGFVGVVHPPR